MPDIVKYRCPHLGLENDPVTWFAFPTKENCCHLRRSPRVVEPSYQYDYCLSENYKGCPLLAPRRQAKPAPDNADEGEQEPAPPRRKFVPWLWGGAILAIIAGALFFFGGPLSGQGAPAPQPPSSTPTLQPTGTPTATLEPTIAPTNTLSPTATAGSTLSATTAPAKEPSPAATEPMQLTLAFDSYVRAGPGLVFDTVAYLSAGTSLTVLGRDLDGFWLLVRLDSGKEGWVAITQFPADTLDIKSVPVAPEIPTPDVTATPGA
jgi:hypothetical protein